MTGMAAITPPTRRPVRGLAAAAACRPLLDVHAVLSPASPTPESPDACPDPELPRAGHRRSDLPVPGPWPLTAPPAPPGSGSGFQRLVTAVDRKIPDCRRRQRQLAVLVLTVDEICGADGQPVPALEEPLMTEFGRRLCARVRAVDQVMWLGGRDYGVILCNCPLEATPGVQQRLSNALSGIYRLDATRVTVRCTLGAASYPAAGANGEQLVAVARQLQQASMAAGRPGG